MAAAKAKYISKGSPAWKSIRGVAHALSSGSWLVDPNNQSDRKLFIAAEVLANALVGNTTFGSSCAPRRS